MTRQFDLWTQLYPQRNSSSDAPANAKVRAQRKALVEAMCADVNHILAFVEGMGKQLRDHYNNLRYICSEIKP
jgi:hypothetical protein